jgi:cation diffusion facilitator CzcD-associated flavoprotein CzcO/predicted ATP-grasp superfamily ATP-dependent carboligase
MTRFSSRDTSVDALVVDAAQRPALVAIRTLGKAGITVGALDSEPHAPGLASRWCAVASVTTGAAQDQDAYVDALLRFCAEHAPKSLILAHDGSIEAVRRRRDQLERVVGLGLAPEPALAVAIDKTRTLAFARAVDLREPRGCSVGSIDEAASAIAEVGLPAVVKPTRSWAQGAGPGRRLHAVVAGTRFEALGAIEAILGEGIEVVLQEWLPGAREALSFFHAHGRTWARFAQRADRTFPPLGGNSVLRESIPLPPDIAPAAERLVAELGLDGYSEVEFRRDAQGRAALMEINPRLSASVEIAVRAGVPFPRLLHDWASGEPLVEAHQYRTGLRMRWLGGDLLWLRDVFKQESGPDVPSRKRAVGAVARDFARPAGYDYLDRSDPRPALVAATGVLRRLRKQRRAGDPASGAFAGLDASVVVIGAGPYGLSVSAHLSALGVRHEVFGTPMELWTEHMPTGMYLKSEGFASNLSDPLGEHTLERFCVENEREYEYRRIAAPIPRDTFARYGRWFQERLVGGLRGERVERVRRAARGFELQLSTGTALRAGRVVMATGMTGHAYLPPVLENLPRDRVLHSYDHRDPAQSRDADVAVIGAGQSALEAAALLREHGAAVRVIARTGQLTWNAKPGGPDRPWRARLRYPESGLGEGALLRMYADWPAVFHRAPEAQRQRRAYTALGPAGAWWLRPRIEGKVELLPNRQVIAAQARDGRIRLQLQGPTGTEQLEAELVVAGTGYRPKVANLECLDYALRDSIKQLAGTPLLDADFQSSVPDLYFVGYLAALSFGPVMRFVLGTDFAARRVARRLAR